MYAIDPSKAHLSIISSKFGSLDFFRFFNIALSNSTKSHVPLYSAGSLGGTLIQDAVPEFPGMEYIDTVNVVEWFTNNINSQDIVFLKVNCEGCEAYIVPPLIESRLFQKLEWVMIDFDVRKHAATGNLETKLREMLSEYKNWADQSVMIGPPTHELRIRQWLCKRPLFFQAICV